MSKDLHDEIMNISAATVNVSLSGYSDDELKAYKIGRRDARHAAAELVAASAAAPQVVADERAAQYAGVPEEHHDRYRVEKTEGGFWPYCVKCGNGTQILYVGTLKQCELVAHRLFGAFADGHFFAFAAAPVQPVAVPDGWRDKLAGMSVSMDVSTGDDDAFHRVFGEVEGVMPQGDSRVILAVETSRNFAAPAAQGDAKDEAYEFAAQIIELFDDATMLADHMLDVGECAAVIRALKSTEIAAIAAKAAS